MEVGNGHNEVVRADIHRRLKRIEGQVRGLARMVEEARPCDEVLTQIMATRTALDRVALHLVRGHVEQCIEGLPREEAAVKISRAFELLSRVS